MKTFHRATVCILCLLMLCLCGCLGKVDDSDSYLLDDHLKELFAYTNPDTQVDDSEPMPEVHIFYDNTQSMLGYMNPPTDTLPLEHCDAHQFMSALQLTLPAGYKAFWLDKDAKNEKQLSWQKMSNNLFDLYTDVDGKKANFYISSDGSSFRDEDTGKPLSHTAGARLPDKNGVDIGPLRLLIEGKSLVGADAVTIDPDAITVIVTDLLDQNCMGSELAEALYKSVIANDEDGENAVFLLAMECQFHGDRAVPDPNKKNGLVEYDKSRDVQIVCPMYWIMTGPRKPLCRFVDKLNAELKAKGITSENSPCHWYCLHGNNMGEAEFADVVDVDTVDLNSEDYDLTQDQKEAVQRDAAFFGNRNVVRTDLKELFGEEITGFSEVFSYRYEKTEDLKYKKDKEMLLNLYIPLPSCTADNLDSYRCYLDPQLTEAGAMLFEDFGGQDQRIFALRTDRGTENDRSDDEEKLEGQVPETESSPWEPVNYFEFVNAGFALSTEILPAEELPEFSLSEAELEELEEPELTVPAAAALDGEKAEYWLLLTLHGDFSGDANPYEALVLDIPVWASLRNDPPEWVSEWNTTKPSKENYHQTYGLKAFCEKMADSNLSQKAYDEKNGVNIANLVLVIGELPT